MDEALDWRRHRQAWADGLLRQTGQDVAAWNARIAEAAPADEAALRAWLETQGVKGYSRMLLVMETFGYPDFLTATADELVEAQYADRPALRPIYDAVVRFAATLSGTAVQARKTYVCLVTPRRTYARIQATTRTRLDIALRLAGDEPSPRLAPSRIHETMPVQVSLQAPEDFDAEARRLLELAHLKNS